MNRVLVITERQGAFDTLKRSFAGYHVQQVESCDDGLRLPAEPSVEYVFVDIDLMSRGRQLTDFREYRQMLQPLWQKFPSAQLVVLSESASIRQAVKAVKVGASDYLTYPLTIEEVNFVRDSIDETLRLHGELDHLRDHFWQHDVRKVVITQSPVMQVVFDKVRRVAQTKTTVLLTGETGTGKNLVAKLLHQHSNRSDRQFINVHCGAIPDNLLESELFGHERGSFTGAYRRKLGKFEISDSGTIFLDEIGTITPSMQIKMLQVLQDRNFQRVGGEETIEVDVRILAATNVDLKRAVQDGNFRNDLYFRLNVFPIELPPLRERREDIPYLVELFIDKNNQLYPKVITDVHPLVMQAFQHYQWPGNVRELESIIERAYLLENTSLLTPESFPKDIFEFKQTSQPVYLNTNEPLAVIRRRAIEQIERQYLKAQLSRHKGRVNMTAQASGVTVRQLHKLMTKHDLKKEDFKR